MSSFLRFLTFLPANICRAAHEGQHSHCPNLPATQGNGQFNKSSQKRHFVMQASILHPLLFLYYKQIVPCNVQTTVHSTKIHTANIHDDEGSILKYQCYGSIKERFVFKTFTRRGIFPFVPVLGGSTVKSELLYVKHQLLRQKSHIGPISWRKSRVLCGHFVLFIHHFNNVSIHFKPSIRRTNYFTLEM